MKIDINELDDFRGSLKKLKSIVDELVFTYGEYSLVEFDAGYNNVSVTLETGN